MVVVIQQVKAAISLNNYAVALMSKGFIPEAVDTLKDCVKILSIVSDAQVTTFTREQILEVESFLSRAHNLTHKRFAMAFMESKSRPSVVVKPCSNHNTAYMLLNNSDFSCDVAIPIFIEVFQPEEEWQDLFNTICAMVFYNFGLSQSLFVERIQAQENKARIQASAYSFFKLSQELLLRTPMHETKNQCMILDMLVIRCLLHYQIGLEMDKSTGEDYNDELYELISNVLEQHRLCPVAHELRNAPAA